MGIQENSQVIVSSNIQELAAEVQQLKLELETSKSELESFCYSISHDLRAPLRCIDGFSQALLEDYGDKLDSTAQGYLQNLRSSSQLMGQLIDAILHLSRLSRTEIHLDKVDLSKLANEAVEELIRTHPECKGVFVIADQIEAYGDENLLKLVFQNLLGDALKSTMKQDQPKIEFGMADFNGEISYYVRDNSIGFDMKYDSDEEFTDSGVGLATVQRIITRLGGRVWAEENPGKGATFFFTLQCG